MDFFGLATVGLEGVHAPVRLAPERDLGAFPAHAEQQQLTGVTEGVPQHEARLGPEVETGSSDIRWGSWGESAGGEEHAEAVVVAVAVAAGEAAVQLDDPVHRLGSAVR